MWSTILISLRFMKISRNLSRHLFMNTITQVFQINILEIFKMWSFIFVSSKLTEIFQNFYKFQFIQLIKIVLVSNIFVNFLNTQKEDHFIKSLSDEPLFSFLCHALIIRNQRWLSSRLLVPMLIGTPCIKIIKTTF